MKKIILILFLALFLIGCSDNLESIKEFDYEKIESLSSVEEVIKALPGSTNILTQNLSDEKRYIINYKTSISNKDVISKWKEAEIYKEMLLFNGSIILSKEPKLESVTFYIDTEEVSA